MPPARHIQPKIDLDIDIPGRVRAMSYAREAQRFLISTHDGELCVVTALGAVVASRMGFGDADHACISDNGQEIALILGGSRLFCLEPDLSPRWNVKLNRPALAISLSPHGNHIAVSTDSGRTHIVDRNKRETALIEAPRPLAFLALLTEKPELIAAAEYGHLAAYDLTGKLLWDERPTTNVGAMAVTGDGKRILLAAFNHGVQVYNGSGRHLGAFVVDGVPRLVSVSYDRRRIAVVTLEERFFWLNFDGNILFVDEFAADPPVALEVDPLGEWVVLAQASGRLTRMKW